MNFSELVKQRRSVRKFKDQPVPREAIMNMIDAAVHAPSASNRQPWRFMVLDDADARRNLAQSVREAVSERAKDMQPGFEGGFRDYSRHFLYFEQAPVLILALYRAAPAISAMFRENTTGFERMNNLELNGATVSVAMAVQNMLLSATDQGLGTCVMTGPLIAEEAFERVLPVPQGWKILCMVCVGYADEIPGKIRKKTAEQVIIPLKTGEKNGVQ